MKKLLLLGLLLPVTSYMASAQCTTSNGTSCVCESSSTTDCDLLPDIIAARPPLLVNGSAGVIEYSQSGNGANDGQLRISVSTPNIGHGPLEVRTTTQYICGTDTITGTAPATCPNTGLPPTQLLVQRVYHKNGNAMSYYERAAGSMTYHPSHGHMHVDDWGIFSLRTATSNPDPLTWPIVGNGAKLAFCLMDYGTCSGYNGHCVDSLGNVLTNSSFPNYGLGGGAYSCSQVVQGISSGFTDIYYQGLTGMYIDIPPGTCNGDYYIVVELDPHNYFLEENENNNVIAVPYTLTLQESAPPANISSLSGISSLCSGTSMTLETPNGPNYSYQWSTGETTQNINVSTQGTYTVSVTSACGSSISQPFQVTEVGAAPITTDDHVCVEGIGTLHASGSGSIKWYDIATGGSPIATGNDLITPLLNTSTTYYAEVTDSIPPFINKCLPVDNSIGVGSFFASSQSLIFDVLSGFTLKSVKIFAQTAGDMTVELRNSGGVIADSLTVNVPSGESRVNLDWYLSPGTNYAITRADTFALYRNNSGVNYPYTIPGYLSIHNSTAGTDFYYFFYDWEIGVSGQVCVSSRTPATLNVHKLPKASVSANGPVTICKGDNVTLSVNTDTGTDFQWKKYGNIINGASNASYLAYGNGKYRCIVTDPFGCSRTSNKIAVNVLPLPSAIISANGPTSICVGDSVTFTANSGSGLTYQWKKYANDIPGETGLDYVAYDPGKYKVVVTSSNGCARGSNSYFVDISCREAFVFDDALKINVYPNPATDACEVDFLWNENEVVNIEVLDLLGQLHEKVILPANSTANHLMLDTKELARGHYIIRIHNGKTSINAPLILK